jgi:hypothetical protein
LTPTIVLVTHDPAEVMPDHRSRDFADLIGEVLDLVGLEFGFRHQNARLDRVYFANNRDRRRFTGGAKPNRPGARIVTGPRTRFEGAFQ